MYVARLCCMLLAFAMLWVTVGIAHAQDAGSPYLEITHIDVTQEPVVQVSLAGGNLPGALESAPVTLYEGTKAQALLGDETVDGGLQLAIAVDPYNIQELGATGQSHHAELIGATLDLIERQVITRNVDLAAVYTIQPDGEVQTLQEWTGEPNLVFNSLVQHQITETTSGDLGAALLLGVLNRFEEREITHQTRALLLYTTGMATVDVAAVAAEANRLGVHIHPVMLAGEELPGAQAEMLQQLAQQTQGRFVSLATGEDLLPLWEMLAGMRRQRLLTYQSSREEPAQIRASLELPNGAYLEATAELAAPPAVAVQEAAAVETAPATPPVETSSTPEAVAGSAGASEASPTEAPPTIAAAEPAPGDEATSPDVVPGETASTGSVIIPGTTLAIPRAVLQLALPLLLLAVGYLVYREMRERRAQPARRRKAERAAPSPGNRLYELSEQTDDDFYLAPQNKAADRYALEEEEELPVAPAAPRPLVRPAITIDEEEATVVPRPRFGDDDATYRLAEEVEQPIIGYLVRVSGSPTLPDELPIFGLPSTRGEARQIHIGRHSKNNTVVINDKSISREHTVLVQKEGRLYVRDNASTAGTFLNGKRLKPGEELLLRNNDLVGFGEIIYEFRARGEDEATVVGE